MSVAAGASRAKRSTSRITRHLLLGLCSLAVAAAVFSVVPAKSLMFRLSVALAYPSLGLLAVALAIGPLSVLRGRPNPVSTDARRDVGIWAGMLGLAHVVAGLQAHMGGQMRLYFLYPPDVPRPFAAIRLDAFGVANYVGLGATVLLVFLLALSNDASLRALGAERWKAAQRTACVGFGLTVVHGALYQVIERRQALLVTVFVAMVALVVALQGAGWRRVRGRSSRPVEASTNER